MRSSRWVNIPGCRCGCRNCSRRALRATGIAFAFNAPRFIAFLGPLFAGTLIVHFGGFSRAAMIISLIYILGFCVVPFLPETKGKPLPA